MKNLSNRSGKIMSILLAICLLLGACKNMSKSQKGTYIGAAGGAAAGAAIGKAAGNTAMGYSWSRCRWCRRLWNWPLYG